MTDESNQNIPRHAEAQEGAEVKVRSTEEGGVRVSFSDGSDDLEVSRREFMRISGVAAASAAMSGAACRYPKDEIVPYVDRPDDFQPGHANQFATVCQGCSAECGTIVKSRAARPIKLDGNPDHPTAEGSLCARGQAAHRDLYDPDRAEGPLEIRENGNHINPENGWADIDTAIIEQLQSNADSVHILTGPRSGSAERALLDELTDQLDGAHWYQWEPLAAESVTRASEISYGTPQTPRYRFEDAKVVVSLGSDFLGTWLSPSEHTNHFADNRDPDQLIDEYAERHDIPEDERWITRLVAFEGHMSLTGSRADDRYRVRPSDLPAVAMALAHDILVNQGHGTLADNDELATAVESFSPDAVAERLDLDAEALTSLAAELVEHAGESIVISGQAGSSTPDGVSLETAVNLLNRALGNVGETVERGRSSRQNLGRYDDLTTLVERMNNGEVGVLIVDDVNPVYAAPPELDVAGAMDNVPTIISTNDRVDETAIHGDYLAPGQHWLESWGDSSPIAGTHAIQQPAIQPLYNTRSFEENLLAWFGKSELAPSFTPYLEDPDKPNGQTGPDVPYDPGAWYRYLRSHWKETIFPQSDSLASFDSFWESVLRQGSVELPDDNIDAPSFRPAATADALPADLPDDSQGDPGNLDSMQIHTFASIPLGDGSMANNGHLQELPDPISKHTWGSYALVSPATFKAAGLEQGDILAIDSADGSETLEFPVIMQPGMHDDVIAVPLGYGRTHAGTVANDVGANAYKLTGTSESNQIFSGRNVSVSNTGRNQDVSIIQGSQLVDLEQRPLMATATREDYEKHQDAGVGTHPPAEDLWESHDYETKWGMSIDMSRCTGCAACMTACQEENNVPVVGRSGVMEGREMHWIRIDRYYRLPKNEEVEEARSSIMDDPMYDQEPYISFGDQMTNPQVLMHPMLCQHCENAPCETVCPVLATTHSDDGLNQMTYNRCVGTRYCSNNCPFKVRRFNWYNYSRDRSDSIFASIEPELEEHGRLNAEEPQSLALNPEVTVRSRGVMEKCTFCVQRIRRAKWENIEAGRERFREDDVVTACEQACPADAIDFGNLLDPEHTVSEQHDSPRAVSPLSHLNVKSSVASLSDVRDTTQHDRYPKHEAHGGGHGDGHGDGDGDHGDGHGGSGESGQQTNHDSKNANAH